MDVSAHIRSADRRLRTDQYSGYSNVRIIGIVLSALAAVASIALRIALSDIPLARRVSQFGVGASVMGGLHFTFPVHPALSRVRRELLRMGGPAYFLFNILYDNASTHEEKMLYISLMLTLWGMVCATLVDSVATAHLFRADTTKYALSEMPKTFTLLGDSGYIKAIKPVALTAVGVGGIVLSQKIKSPPQILAKAFVDWGVFFIARGAVAPLWRLVEEWIADEERDFEASLHRSSGLIFPTPPTSLRAMRIARHVFRYVGPMLVTGCFAYPNALTLGVAGTLDAISDETERGIFCHDPLGQAYALQPRRFSSNARRYGESTWKVVRLMAEVGGLAYYNYLVFNIGKPVFEATAVSFTAGIVIGYGSTTIADRTFNHLDPRPWMTSLFFRCVLNPDLLKMFLLFFFYTAGAGIKIGDKSLGKLSFGSAMLAFTSWGGYGYGLGHEMALGDSSREGNKPITPPIWLIFVNVLLFIQAINGQLKP